MKTENMGLTSKQAYKNQMKYGFNELAPGKKTTPVALFFRQFGDVLTLTLICATVLSLFLGEYSDAVTVLIIVVMNGILGFVQEYKTEKSIEALKELSAPESIVIRDGAETKIPSREVTVGDVVILEAGDKICADCKVLTSSGLSADESALTGESVGVEKSPQGDNSVYMGTTVIGGRGSALVEKVGMSTKMGSIAHMLKNTVSTETPLKKYLNKIGKELVIICAGVCVLIFIAGMFHGQSGYDMFLSAVSLAVAAIPEGLPAAVTVSLTIGVSRMLKRNALIRKLPAIETLGCTNVICSDKTGTLTENKMTVKKVYFDGRIFDVSRDNPSLDSSVLSHLITCGYLCNNVSVCDGKLSGDPTEMAVYDFSSKSDVNNNSSEYTRIFEIPFDSERKCMTVICRDGQGNKFAFVKGAADKIISLCDRRLTSRGAQPFADKQKIKNVAEKMGDEALRVLAFAYKPITDSLENPEQNLIFIGMEGMLDLPRREAYQAIKKCYDAGIRPVMITGDHKNTAGAIAEMLGFRGNNVPVTGAEIEKMSDDKLAETVEDTNVFARVSPSDKLRIVRAFKRRKNVVAMTGDGVNDAPSLKEADIGIAMGRCGTDVAKEAADMILLDDNFSTIISAVEEGRAIYGNIRKFIRYLLSCNLGEIIIMGAAAFCGMPMPLIPIQILWLNLVTDGLPALALGADSPEEGVMNSNPRKDGESIFSKGLGGNIAMSGILIGAESLLAFSVARFVFGSLEIARTVAFATLIFSELIYAFECRSESKSIFSRDIFSNVLLLSSVLLSAFLTFCVIYIPALSVIFKTVPLTLKQWGMVTCFGMIEFVIGSLFIRKSDNNR